MQFVIDSYFPDDIHTSGDTGMASFEDKRPLYVSGSKDFLAFYQDEIRKLHSGGATGTEITHLICRMMDELINKLFHSILDDFDASGSSMERITLVAAGGYGRGQLNPRSDIDIMFLYDEGAPVSSVEDIAQKLLYFLWDMRLDVGYSVRTVKDCVEMAQTNDTIKTALMDSRYLGGGTSLFEALQHAVFKQIMPHFSDRFIKNKVADMKSRRKKYGSTVYLLEPNLKEGEGGLRDLQTALWIARIKYKFSNPRELVIKGIISEQELDSYYSALDYLWKIRNELHYFSGRKNDQLTFDAQVHLAKFLEYKHHGKTLAVEDFMRDYYRRAVKVEYLVSTIVSRCVASGEGAMKIMGYFIRRPVGDGCFVLKGQLIVPDERVVEKSPVTLMRIFELAQKHAVELSVPLMGLIRKNLRLVNDKFRRNREVCASFLNILRSRRDVCKTLRLMHHMEFLNHFIPEMESIYCKVQHDVYHIYTVDVHTLVAIEETEKILNGELRDELGLPCKIADQIAKPELLYLSVLLHDIGKGSGGGHAEKGAAMVPAIARRMGLSKESSERLEFLIRNHLFFAHIAQRRDLSDEKMICQFAEHMESSENLKMLYLLTVADIRAVGPDVWNAWKSSLFQELYEKTFDVLERGEFRFEARSEQVKAVSRKIVDMLENEYTRSSIFAELKSMPVNLLLLSNSETIAGHVRLLLDLGQSPALIRLEHHQESGYSEFTLCARDMPGLFARLTGVMAAHGVNILGARINTTSKGKVLDILQVNFPMGAIITDEARWDKVKTDMEKAIRGELDVALMVEKRQRPVSYGVRQVPCFPIRVEFDNDVSETYTVIDVYAHDKVGLLYLITSTLTGLGLYIGVSKISTRVDQVADVFYVHNILGYKITDESELENVREQLRTAIDEWV